MAPRLNAQEKQWQREDDARTLARAEEIKVSPVRLNGAVKEAKVMAKKSEQQVKALKQVARKSRPVTHSNKKTPSKIAKRRK